MKKRTREPKTNAVKAIIDEVFRQKGIFTEEEKEIALKKIYKGISEGKVKEPQKKKKAKTETPDVSEVKEKELTREQIEDIRSLKSQGYPITSIAKLFGTTVERIDAVLKSIIIDPYNELLSQSDFHDVMSREIQGLISATKTKLESAVPGSKEYNNLAEHHRKLHNSLQKVTNEKVRLLKLIEGFNDKSSKKSEKQEIEVSPKGEVELTPKQIEKKKYYQAKALEIMKDEDPVTYLLRAYNKLHPGDRDVGKVLLMSIGCLFDKNSEGIQPSLIGTSRFGKSHSCESMLFLVPKESILDKERIAASLSAKSLYYAENLEPGTIIFFDDVEWSKPLESTVKKSTGTGFQKGTVHKVTIGVKQETKRIPPRMSWWLTSVNPAKSEQIVNRQFVIRIDESPEHLKEIEEHIKDRKKRGGKSFPLTARVLICREIFQKIKEEGLFEPIVPFSDEIVFSHLLNPSEVTIFFDAMTAFTVLRYMQREKDDKSRLITTKKDFVSAKKLFNKHMKERTFTDLTEKQLELWEVTYGESSEGHDPIDRETLAKKMGYKSVDGIRKLLKSMRDKKGLLGDKPTDIIQETRGKASRKGGMRPYLYSTKIPPGEAGGEWVSLRKEPKKSSKLTTKESRTASSKGTKRT